MIKDLIKVAKQPNANIELLMQDSYNRGLRDGVELAKQKAIKAIKNEK